MKTCGSSGRCGGCSLLDRAYSVQLEMKREQVARCFSSAGLKLAVHPVEGMEDPYHYRNKVIAYITMRDGHIAYGMYEEYTHKIVHTPSCLLHNEILNRVLESVRIELDALHIKAYGYGGVLKQVLLRIGVRTGQVLLVFVTSDDMFHGRADLVRNLVAKNPEIRTIVQNVNRRDTNVVLGERERVLYGPGFICDRLLGNSFKISSRSFYQINPVQTEKLYRKALELAEIGKDDLVMDAYCGIGTIGISASAEAGAVIGIEINRDAVEDAIGNARYNKIPNARFYCDDVKRFMREFDAPVDILIVDPPRSGCDAEFLRAVRRMRPRRIVYISCNPETQARDIAELSGSYRAGDAWPVDMFPQTEHVENIVALSLKH